MSIASEIQRIKTNIANAYTQANEKGATLPQQQNSDNLADTISSIQVSDGSSQQEDIVDPYDAKNVIQENWGYDIEYFFSLNENTNKSIIYPDSDVGFSGGETVQDRDKHQVIINPSNILDIGIFGTSKILYDYWHPPMGIYIVSATRLNLTYPLFVFEYLRNDAEYKAIYTNSLEEFVEVEANNRFYYYSERIEQTGLCLKRINDFIRIEDLEREYFENDNEEYQQEIESSFENSSFIRENEIQYSDLLTENFWKKVFNICISDLGFDYIEPQTYNSY